MFGFIGLLATIPILLKLRRMKAALAQYMHYGWNAWWMSLSMTLFWAAAIGIAITLVRAFARRDQCHSRAREILDERLARGDTDGDEYQARNRELEQANR